MAGNVVHVNPLVQKEGEFDPVFHAGRLKSLHITPASSNFKAIEYDETLLHMNCHRECRSR